MFEVSTTWIQSSILFLFMCLKDPYVATRICVNCSRHANIEANGTVKRDYRYVPNIFLDKEFYICLKFSDLITLLMLTFMVIGLGVTCFFLCVAVWSGEFTLKGLFNELYCWFYKFHDIQMLYEHWKAVWSINEKLPSRMLKRSAWILLWEVTILEWALFIHTILDERKYSEKFTHNT
jgi:hypothetical protein